MMLNLLFNWMRAIALHSRPTLPIAELKIPLPAEQFPNELWRKSGTTLL